MEEDYDKSEIREFVKDQINGKIKTLDFYRNFTLEASRDIRKTPKYDSIREEIQEEMFHLDKQMHALKTMQTEFAKVLNRRFATVRRSSLVITNKARFYISVSLGEFFFKGLRFYAISPESPMAKIMEGKKEGDDFTLNNIYQKIEKIL